ncbi:hypothetical protein Daus18300_003311 [Diaporthe australafricana]|uniref:Zn(2)-C6 fungal-type domain-containing protein n=1 Tax=Diaporthe australafricana TaxID=127596 RepID=A0ABR3XHJ7_9PEZI
MSASYSNPKAPDPPEKSRRKNCNACVWSKRRCDKRTPRCTRCAAKNFTCVYQSLPPSSATTTGGGGGTPAGADDYVGLEEGGVPAPPHSFDFNSLDSSHSESAAGTCNNSTLVMNELADRNATVTSPSIGLTLDANMMFDFNAVLIADSMQVGNMQSWEVQQTPVVVSKTLAPEVPHMGSICTERDEILGGFQPWHIYEPDSRIGYIVDYFTKLHITFAQTKETPFLHRHVYRGLHSTPRPLIAAYTAISAYTGRTAANKGWAIRAVCEGAAEVLKTAGDDAPAALTSHEKLARAQALWLLQTVRCFDGDVSLRAQAVRDMGVLKKWLKDLECLKDNLDDVHMLDDAALRQRPPRSWEGWVFNECVRRTVFVGNLLTSLFELLNGDCDDSFEDSDLAKWMTPHRWTFSKALWDAQSSPAFFSTWRDKPIFIINSFYVQIIPKVARPADIDEFARLFLILAFGVEETKHFMLQV